MVELLYKTEVYAIVGAAIEVYNNLGPGFLEAVYQEALELEFAARAIPAVSQKEIRITYKSQTLKKNYVADFLAYGRIIVEIKAMASLTSREEAQVLNYLKATGCEVAVLINFGSEPKMEWRRMVCSATGRLSHEVLN